MSSSTLRLMPSPRMLVGAVLTLGLLALMLHVFLGPSSVRTAYIQPVTLEPPPPPPAPPPQVKPPEEPLESERPIHEDTTQDNGPVTDGPPGPPGPPGPATAGLAATGPLGFNEGGEAGSDVFGLAARRGGHELLLTAPRGGGGDRNARFFRYADTLQSSLQTQLNEVQDLRRSCYSLEVTVRVSAEGGIEDVKIHRTTGDPALDARIRGVLSGLHASDNPPPPDMPWPVGLRIVSRRADCMGAASAK